MEEGTFGEENEEIGTIDFDQILEASKSRGQINNTGDNDFSGSSLNIESAEKEDDTEFHGSNYASFGEEVSIPVKSDGSKENDVNDYEGDNYEELIEEDLAKEYDPSELSDSDDSDEAEFYGNDYEDLIKQDLKDSSDEIFPTKKEPEFLETVEVPEEINEKLTEGMVDQETLPNGPENIDLVADDKEIVVTEELEAKTEDTNQNLTVNLPSEGEDGVDTRTDSPFDEALAEIQKKALEPVIEIDNSFISADLDSSISDNEDTAQSEALKNNSDEDNEEDSKGLVPENGLQDILGNIDDKIDSVSSKTIEDRSLLDEAISKIGANNDAEEELVDNSGEQKFDSSAVNFHFAKLDQFGNDSNETKGTEEKAENKPAQKELQEAKEPDIMAYEKEEDRKETTADKPYSINDINPSKPHYPVYGAVEENLGTDGRSDSRHLDFSGESNNIVIPNEKVDAKKLIKKIIYGLFLIAFVMLLSYAGFKIFGEVKRIK
ncbi:TPA: hypothetical protein DDW69_03175 [candidate division CPR2 bacterium]|uniref:Uncharacterized protein n=1 Tax=candidate division CPR2 bacterium GW2011_GWC1_41_48 TaxID=1618344 RepID=A0A0G0W7Z9_UNCC2|nr:MAG: hypothetical protein UT47_C0003G0170 [candidate division CPR2 bacterium GW2011_GWC2_39_35]KKR27201.1 MAG: hypothetical protein UT59_C0066G0002 [candidate division CPR2 bacterium GW2011_GWD1_39_7]KKR27429.1 MAG: hypothetical protein UT60_C0049G0002 [candidate division CPR2 bacterium GW2011_GWD2_39_7]KKS09109.1 MAG: hypothetical protein UU65_C0003G0164 [candidate division CPR2 bacterium GW2011_GWC1_41_48]OGB57382.1 MAG: hypothetical protein A2Y27_03690 [candidate division CPR2 bacterium G